MNQNNLHENASQSLTGNHVDNIRKSWVWFVAIGVLVTLCGAFVAGNLLMGTLASMFLLGSLMFVGGVFQIAAAFQVRAVKSLFLTWLISGILFLLACFFAFAWPFKTAAILTFLIAIALGASGIVRLIAGIQARGLNGWVWFVVSGLLGIIAAIFISANIMAWALILPGVFLACDLLFQGISMILFGINVKKNLPSK